MDNKLSELKDVVDYWRKVKSGELPAPGPNEISITVCTLDGAVSRIAALLAELEAKDKRIAELESYVDVGALALSIAELRIYGEDHDNCPTSLSESIDLVLHEFGRNRAELLAKDNHIAELDGILEVSQGDLSDTEDAMHLWAERAKTAEAKLATPVRLPAKLQWSYDDSTTKGEVYSFNNAIDACDIAICKAGFKCVGDE